MTEGEITTAEKSTPPTRGKTQTRKVTKQVIDWLSAEAKAAGGALRVRERLA